MSIHFNDSKDLGGSGPSQAVQAATAALNRATQNFQQIGQFSTDFMQASSRTAIEVSAKKFAFELAAKSRIDASTSYYKLAEEAIKKSGGAGG